jgi:hypothetical protein
MSRSGDESGRLLETSPSILGTLSLVISFSLLGTTAPPVTILPTFIVLGALLLVRSRPLAMGLPAPFGKGKVARVESRRELIRAAGIVVLGIALVTGSFLRQCCVLQAEEGGKHIIIKSIQLKQQSARE